MNPSRQPWKTVAIAAFALVCAMTLVLIYTGTGARLPGMKTLDYKTAFRTPDAGNVVSASDVRMAGVHIGEVASVENKGAEGALIRLELDPEVAPLHQGVTFRVGERSLVGEGTVNVVDGDGAELSSGEVLPGSSVTESVQLHDVLRDLDKPTRKAVTKLVRSLGDSTGNSEEELSQVLAGFGDLGRQGTTAVEAIAAQSDDLEKLAAQGGQVMRALNASEGRLGRLVDSGRAITRATAGQAEGIRASIRQLPGVLTHARSAVNDLENLSQDLRPVAAELRKAAPYLTTALNELPATTRDLRAVLPEADTLLKRAPQTLKEVPTLSKDVSDAVPTLRTTVVDLNPMLAYLRPYGRDVAAFFSNFKGVLEATDEAGRHYLRLAPVLGNEQVPNGVPVRLPTVLTWKNPYPAPGTSDEPGPESGRSFTKVEELPESTDLR